MKSPWDSLDLRPTGEGTFQATIDPAWNVWIVPEGGLVAGLATTAMEAVLGDPGQKLRSMTCVFAGQVPAGEVDISVSMIRRGRSISQLSATVTPIGAAAGISAIAVFGAGRRGHDFTELVPPDVRPPDEIRSWRDGVPEGIDFELTRPPSPFWSHVIEGREVVGTAPWEEFTPGAAEAISWYRFDDPDRAWSAPGAAGVLVCCDTMPGAVWERVGGGWFAPSADLTAHLFSTPASPWLLSHARARWAGDGYASADNALWDMHHPNGPELVAYATQTMFFTFDQP